jgi:hydrogen peroxide-dependent heme synthase
MSDEHVQPAGGETYGVPMTIEGLSMLHQVFRFKWSEWRRLAACDRKSIVQEVVDLLQVPESEGRSALFSILGHKGDILAVHFRDSFEELNDVQLKWNKLRFADFCEQTGSYVSIVELSLHDSSMKLYQQMAKDGVQPFSSQWNEIVEETMTRQREAMRPRLFPKIPETRYICYYPMDRRRGEDKNWYRLPIEERQRQMDLHGTVGRRYAGRVQQIVSGSVGLDDWEWAVDLYGNDPVTFKKLIYEMRFDEVSAVYSNFGQFMIGLRCPVTELGSLVDGNAPKFEAKELPAPAGRPAHSHGGQK